ncbi:uncharacterized protein LOC141909215 isoform X1 [Tubulanus polymorphus]|uniref:uncharacterized protein LOC141909215 isoform X1 n=1 Tax=Tubulanus polymorphus TaxID=672921 RepID=UPI003DA2721B
MADRKKKSTKKGDRIKSAPGVSQVKKQIDALTVERDELLNSRNQTLFENESLKKKLTKIMEKITDNIDRSDFDIKEDAEVTNIDTDDCLEMLSKIITKGQGGSDTIESRVEELETRVTQQSMDIATLTKRALLLEYGLEDTLKCHDVEEVKARVKACLLLVGDPLPEVLVTPRTPQPPAVEKSCPNHHPIIMNSVSQTHLKSETKDQMKSDEDINHECDENANEGDSSLCIPYYGRLPGPDRKGVGETHIRFMNRELKRYIAKELSYEKPSGADWRMLAERVGIALETIKRWRKMRLDCPMAMVFSEWGESPAASVRILHRHLISPQMRCTIIAKRITDFYIVD